MGELCTYLRPGRFPRSALCLDQDARHAEEAKRNIDGLVRRSLP